MIKYDYLIIGAGLSGSVIAERLASQSDKKILVVDRRNHIGGNCYDYYDKSNVLVHKYGAHLFHTKYKIVFDYLSQFTKWHKYEHVVKAKIDEKLYDIPINLNTVNKFFDKNFNSKECKDFLEKIRTKIGEPKNAEEQVLSKVGKELYEKFFKHYTKKQWEIDPKDLAPSVTARIPIRFNKDERYFEDEYQFMPKSGYTKIFKKLLNHKNIEVRLNTEFKDIKSKVKYDNLLYSGCIDEYFDYKYDPLAYRSLKFKFKTFDNDFYQDYCVINYPGKEKYTRILELKHATKQKNNKTTIVYEYPSAEGEPYYPIPRPKNQELYEKYSKLAKKLKNTYFMGRLGEYRYLNMDQVVYNSLELFNKLKY